MEGGGDKEGVGEGGEGVGHAFAGSGVPLLGVDEVLRHGYGEGFVMTDGESEQGGEEEEEEEGAVGRVRCGGGAIQGVTPVLGWEKFSLGFETRALPCSRFIRGPPHLRHDETMAKVGHPCLWCAEGSSIWKGAPGLGCGGSMSGRVAAL